MSSNFNTDAVCNFIMPANFGVGAPRDHSEEVVLDSIEYAMLSGEVYGLCFPFFQVQKLIVVCHVFHFFSIHKVRLFSPTQKNTVLG